MTASLRVRAGVGGKFVMLIVLVPAILAVALVGARGVQKVHASATTLNDSSLRRVQDTATLVSAAYALHETALLQVAADSDAVDGAVTQELEEQLIPGFRTAVATLRRDFAGDRSGLGRLDAIEAGLTPYLQLQTANRLRATDGSRRIDDANRARLATRIDDIFTRLVAAGEQLRHDESQRATRTRNAADADYRTTLLELGIGVVLALALLAVLGMIRGLVPRIRAYSRFASEVAAGRPTEPLVPTGSDELTELGLALNHLVAQRDRVSVVEQAQAEFVETLQVTGTEDEAQALVQRHLERSLPAASAVVLRRNNSANRIEAATVVPDGDPLLDRITGADVRACAALRVGKTHREGTGREPLLSCTLCHERGKPSTCEPLLVGGEVIGSVLVTYGDKPADDQEALVRNTVAQAAPMLANLRNLALAEFRANSDALTGLPNKRATDDTLKRMVAQASRSVTPLCAVMLDLDHFKQINDRYGHGRGDEVLASVGTVITACLRASDFAGRFGGEEFLVLLPDAGIEAALQVAERMAVASITVVGVDRDITASLGVADLLEHGGSGEGLLREADRALYTAKNLGRDRVVPAGEVEQVVNEA